MAHMAGNEPNLDISSKIYDVQKTVPQKYKTAWALGLKDEEWLQCQREGQGVLGLFMEKELDHRMV